MRQIVKNDLIFKRMNSLLAVHDQSQDSILDFWRIVVPDVTEMKEHIVQELHSTLYSAQPGIQRTVGKVRKFFIGKECWVTLGSLWRTAMCVRWKNLTTL